MYNGLLTIITQHMIPIQRSQYSLVKLKAVIIKIIIVVSMSCGWMYIYTVIQDKKDVFHTIILIVPKGIY